MQPRTLLRTPETYAEYAAHTPSKECFICEAPTLQDFTHWRIIQNSFPYDAVADQHRMLVPKRHVPVECLLTEQELREYASIKDMLRTDESYDSLIENFASRTFGAHWHVHLLSWRRDV